jgi:thiol-disulfide isomerase/thioredoxin
MVNLRARWWVAAAALLALALGVRVWNHFHHPHLLHAGDRLSALDVSSLTGTRLTLSPAGRPQLIHIFATWCMPCRIEMPLFAAAAPQLERRGFDVIGIDQQESGSQVARFAEEFDITYPLYIDTTGITHTVLGARFIPTTLLVGSDGRIRWIHPGPMTEKDLTDFKRMEKEPG